MAGAVRCGASGALRHRAGRLPAVHQHPRVGAAGPNCLRRLAAAPRGTPGDAAVPWLSGAAGPGGPVLGDGHTRRRDLPRCPGAGANPRSGHRRRAWCEGRIRCAKDTGLRNLPCRATRRTRSGARSSFWPANYWPGCRCSPSPPRPGAGDPDGCGCCYSPPPSWAIAKQALLRPIATHT